MQRRSASQGDDLVRSEKAAPPPGDDSFEFVMSDGSVDRMGDVIEPDGWKLKQFRQNPIALFGHSSSSPVGVWENVRVESGKLLGRLAFADEGTSPFIDTLRSLVRQKILRAVSVGFRPLKHEKLDEDSSEWGGPFRFLEQELLECSLVSVPANANALSTAKALNLSPAIVAEIFSKSANENLPIVRADNPARQPQVLPPKGKSMNTLAQRIENARANLVTMRGQLEAIANKDTRTEAEDTEAATLSDRIEATQGALAQDERFERSLARSEPGTGTARVAAPAVHGRSIILPKKIDPRELVTRSMAVHFISKMTGRSLGDVLAATYPGDDATAAIVTKAAIAPATTTTAGWAAELVGVAIADFLDNLPRTAIYPVLAGRGPRFTFGRNGIIKVPARAATPKINGSFVGEGQPIPVRKLGLTAISLTPKKMAVISEFTREIAMHSTPAIEGVIRTAINDDTAEAIDTALIDTVAADAIRPAGLRNGVAAIPASAALATAFETMVADLKALINAIVANRGGRNLVLLCNPAQMLALNWVTIPGVGFVFTQVEQGVLRDMRVVASPTVPARMLILVDAADFASATGDVPEFDVSDVATLHEEDTTPLPISATGTPNVVAAPVRSLWQTASIGIRMLLDMNWAMRRVGMVAWTDTVNW